MAEGVSTDPIPILSWRGSPLVKKSQAGINNIPLNASEDGSPTTDGGDLEEYWSKMETIDHVENNDGDCMAADSMRGPHGSRGTTDGSDISIHSNANSNSNNSHDTIEMEEDVKSTNDSYTATTNIQETFVPGSDDDYMLDPHAFKVDDDDDDEPVFPENEYDDVDYGDDGMTVRHDDAGEHDKFPTYTGEDASSAVAKMLQDLDSLKLNKFVTNQENDDENDDENDGGRAPYSAVKGNITFEDDEDLIEVEDTDEEFETALQERNDEYDYIDDGEEELDDDEYPPPEYDEKLATAMDGGYYEDEDITQAGIETKNKGHASSKEERQQHKKSNKDRISYITRNDSQQEDYDPLSFEEDEKPKKGAASKAISSNRKLLADMAERRRQQELQAEKLLEKAQRKRKKFKDALLEKALKARLTEATTVDGETKLGKVPLAALETKASKMNKIKKVVVQEMSEEEQRKQEEEKKAQVAAVRRKFKEQYKKTLESLMLKNVMKEEEEKAANQKKLSFKKPRIKPMVAESEDDTAISTAAAGSGLQAIRRRTMSSTGEGAMSTLSQKGPKATAATTTVENGNEESMDENPEPTPEEIEERKAKVLAAKMQQMKVSAYLAALADQKKQGENKKIAVEQRAKKRAMILAARVLNEATERKAMSLEDKYTNGVVSIEQLGEGVEKKPKLSKEEREAIMNRLTGVSKKTSTSAYDEVVAVTAPPKKVTKPVLRRSVSNSSNEEKESGDDSDNEKINVLSKREGPAPVYRDFVDWKRKNDVPLEAKVFTMTGWYPCVKQALFDRGWHQNTDPTSPYFDLKWSLRSCEVSLEVLKPEQLTNHFHKNGAITTKVGLLRSLNSLVWFADACANDIIPRGFDLTNPNETLMFMDEFATQEAENILKQVYYRATGKAMPEEETLVSSDDGPSGDVFSRPKTPGYTGGDHALQVNKAQFKVCCEVLERRIRLKESNDEYLDDKRNADDQPVSLLDWEIISDLDVFKNDISLPPTAPTTVESVVRNKLEEEEAIPENNLPPLQKEKLKQQLKDRAKKRVHREAALRDAAIIDSKKMIDVDGVVISRIHSILISMRRLDMNQSGLAGTGEDARNMWIVKPAAKSRGRGIMCFNNLPKLLKYVQADTGTSTLWIVQKYMENSLAVAKRKFDLRQWVLVVDWNPLTIYFYDQCYCRFSVEEYTTEDDNMDNLYVHLVNNSIGKNSEHFGKVAEAEDGQKIEGFMWSDDMLKDHIEAIHGKDYMNEKIRPRMKDIAKWSLMCASDMIDHRKNSWELYGFDFMVDVDFNAWLIEINSSPACDYSTKVTENYVQKALVELLSVTLDTREWDNAKNKKMRGNKPDTGGWECIYKGPLLETPVAAFGADMSLKGEQIKAPKRISNVAPIYSYNGRELSKTLNGSIRQGMEKENECTRDSMSNVNDVSRVEKKSITPAPSRPTQMKSQSTSSRPAKVSTLMRENTPHENATYTLVPTPTRVAATESFELHGDSSNSVLSTVKDRDVKVNTLLVSNSAKIVKPVLVPPPSIDDSITFDDSDGEENVDGETTKFQDTQETGQYTQLPESLVNSISSTVREMRVNTKPVYRQPSNAIPVQPKLFQLDI